MKYPHPEAWNTQCQSLKNAKDMSISVSMYPHIIKHTVKAKMVWFLNKK